VDFTVVGVAADAEQRSPGEAPPPFYYVALAQWYNPAVVLHVRTGPGRGAPVTAAVRATLGELDPTLPLSSIRPIDEALGVFLLPQRLAAWVAGLMGGFGMLLAVIGVYGVSAFLVSRRAREMAVRVALGATPSGVVGLMLRQGGRGPLAGLAVGAVLSGAVTIAAGRFMSGARAADPVVLLGVPLVLALVAGTAIVLPAVRQLRRPIVSMLRDE
jgi:hypothetical protein